MARLIPGSGATGKHCRLFICGERPGREEHYRGMGFVGPAGEELWDRLEQITGLTRDDCWVTNLVKTFSVRPPTEEEIRRDASLLRAELLRVRPRLILTVGYHAARWFLPQFADTTGDVFQGLYFPYAYGTLHVRHAGVVPIVHASAALREPDRYQNIFTDGLRMVDRVLRGVSQDGADPVPFHVSRQPEPYPIGLAGFGYERRQLVAADTEGTVIRPEAVAVTLGGNEACCIELDPQHPVRVSPMTSVIEHADPLVLHHAKYDVQVFHALTIRPRDTNIDCTMEMAYLLGLPQSLKVLAYRLLGFEMAEYEDLIHPIDHDAVRGVLQGIYDQESERRRIWSAREKVAKREAKEAAKAARARQRRTAQRSAIPTTAEARTQGQRRTETPHAHGSRHGLPDSRRGSDARDDAARHLRAAASGSVAEKEPAFPPRALTSLRKVLTTTVAERTLRQRWEGSTFSGHVPLPPPPTWKDVPADTRRRYVMTDAVATGGVRGVLWPQIEQQGLERVYRLDMGVLPWLIRNEEVGLACDANILTQLSKQFAQEYRVILRKIERLAGHPLNPLSGPQVADCLFGELGVTPTRDTKGGSHETTADKYLKARKQEHVIIPLILEARQINKYKGTYTDKLPAMLRDGRYHPNWKYTRTPTGRLAEEIILLIPKHDPLAKEQQRPNRATAIRNAFHAGDGHTLVSVDLSQIELRVMAHESQDRSMLESYAKGEDRHAKVAYELLGAPRKKEDQDDSKHRLPAKTVNFGIINGMTEYGMLDQLHEAGQLQWDIDQVRDMLDGWFRIHAGVKSWWDAQIAHCRKYGYVKDLFGRRRYISAIWSTDPRVVAQAERQTLMAIQSGADGISKVWGRRLWAMTQRRQGEGQYCEPWVRVHDDTTTECDARKALFVKQEMLRLVPDLLCVPTTAEGKTGQQWGDLH